MKVFLTLSVLIFLVVCCFSQKLLQELDIPGNIWSIRQTPDEQYLVTKFQSADSKTFALYIFTKTQDNSFELFQKIPLASGADSRFSHYDDLILDGTDIFVAGFSYKSVAFVYSFAFEGGAWKPKNQTAIEVDSQISDIRIKGLVKSSTNQQYLMYARAFNNGTKHVIAYERFNYAFAKTSFLVQLQSNSTLAPELAANAQFVAIADAPKRIMLFKQDNTQILVKQEELLPGFDLIYGDSGLVLQGSTLFVGWHAAAWYDGRNGWDAFEYTSTMGKWVRLSSLLPMFAKADQLLAPSALSSDGTTFAVHTYTKGAPTQQVAIFKKNLVWMYSSALQAPVDLDFAFKPLYIGKSLIIAVAQSESTQAKKLVLFAQ